MKKEEAIRRIKEFGLYHAIGDLPNSAKTVEAFNMAIEALSEEAKTGEWIEIENGEYLCSNCSRITIGYPPSNCPHRRAKMQGGGTE